MTIMNRKTVYWYRTSKRADTYAIQLEVVFMYSIGVISSDMVEDQIAKLDVWFYTGTD